MVSTKVKKNVKNNQIVVAACKNGIIELDWEKTEADIDDVNKEFMEKLYQLYIEDNDNFIVTMGLSNDKYELSESFDFIRFICHKYFEKLVKFPGIEISRDQTVIDLDKEDSKEILNSVPFLTGIEHINKKWIRKFWENINNSFTNKIAEFNGTVEEFFSQYGSDSKVAGRVYFHLVENRKDDNPFAFLATYAPEGSFGNSKHIPLKNALIEYKDNQKKLLELLSTVNKASNNSEFISELVNLGEIFHPLKFTSTEAYTFLREIPLYEEAGILCRIPNWWKNKSNKLKLSMTVGEKKKSYVGLDSIIDFKAELLIGDDKLTLEELKQISLEINGLAMIKGKWVEVDSEKLKEMLKAYEKAQFMMSKNDLSLVEAMRFQLNAGKALKVDKEMCELEVTNGKWLNSVIKKLKNPESIDNVDCGNNFKAILREYQQKGLNWLNFMKKMGLGACLADDMGLGKTVQVLALLDFIKENRNEKTLLVVPASLISNWVNEFDRFAPTVKYCVLHAIESKNLRTDNNELIDSNDVFITTYTMISKIKWLEEYNWNTVILDEAQAIKNSGTKQTRIVKKLKADYRIAMTGTPIENRLSDLWSLFDFLNKGLLGTTKEFKDFISELKIDHYGYNRLKSVVSPFILRRLKTDKNIISDLPDKIEMKTYADLTKKQIAVYDDLVNELKEKLQSTEAGIERKGLVLASLIKFKQICNHPDQYLGQKNYKESESGKYERLKEICEVIHEKRERVLIFTQFKEIIEPLMNFLEEIFNHKGLSLHGSTSVKRRKEIVEEFQGDRYIPFLVLSIKAGGVGLNLTNANHVIHFDRWWNPAVENQATDRAFRIGQTKNVIVHKFITRGSIEEKIDLMIEDKTKLSNDIMPDVQENWITELDNDKLMDLFRLG